ncbi:MAG: hypothetical protein JJU05_03980 [Verrucomicrobia bacterium]|nr:hypothetical protein [Verrucomicrobiota bacterium]MCH8526436.1 hypothetical protein [Kiritimatiellia bacterium]
MNQYFYHQMSEELAEKLDLPVLAYPVRKEKSLGFIFEGKLAICRLLDELDLYLREHPEHVAVYREAIVKLSWLEGLEAGRSGFMGHAAHYLRLGLDYQPQNLSLRAEYAAALLSLNRKQEALTELEFLIGQASGGIEPLIWMLAARLHTEVGYPDWAQELLKDLVLV